MLVGLGCETNRIHELIRARELDHGERWKESLHLNLQENRGIAQMVDEGVCLIGELLPKVNGIRRELLPLSGLTLALQCGGGEGWSGVTANCESRPRLLCR